MTSWTSEGGQKFDTTKPRMDLLDTYAMEQIALVLGFGAEKYHAHNWRKGIRYSRLIGAAMRHLTAINNGEDTDPESGLPHAAHLGCCVMFLLWMMKNRTDLDDRWKGGDNGDDSGVEALYKIRGAGGPEGRERGSAEEALLHDIREQLRAADETARSLGKSAGRNAL